MKKTSSGPQARRQAHLDAGRRSYAADDASLKQPPSRALGRRLADDDRDVALVILADLALQSGG
jgi:hypothetical protein